MQNRILVIDDDEMVLRSLSSFLTDEQYIVETVDKSELINPAILKFKPGLIILDILLDKSDGRVICDELKSNINTAHIPIVLLTALSYEEIALIDCQADAIIGKPFESSSLLFTIRELIKQGQLHHILDISKQIK